MRFVLALCSLMLAYSPAFAFDPSTLPQTCKDTLAGMQGDKARFAELGKTMQKSQKAKDNENFCKAAREVVMIIKGQSDKLDYCVGDLASDKTAAQDPANQMIQLRGVYKQMLEAAKDAKNDRLHCGLADL